MQIQEDVRGMTFTLSALELEQLIRKQAAHLRAWLDKPHGPEDENQRLKRTWRTQLLDLLEFGADHLEREANYHLNRYELQSLFENFED